MKTKIEVLSIFCKLQPYPQMNGGRQRVYKLAATYKKKKVIRVYLKIIFVSNLYTTITLILH